MKNTAQTTAELVALLSEAIDDLRNIGCDDLADSLTERMEKIVGLSAANL